MCARSLTSDVSSPCCTVMAGKPVDMPSDSSSMVLQTKKISLLLGAALGGQVWREVPRPAAIFPVPRQTDARRPEAPECHFLRRQNIPHFVPQPSSIQLFPWTCSL